MIKEINWKFRSYNNIIVKIRKIEFKNLLFLFCKLFLNLNDIHNTFVLTNNRTKLINIIKFKKLFNLDLIYKQTNVYNLCFGWLEMKNYFLFKKKIDL